MAATLTIISTSKCVVGVGAAVMLMLIQLAMAANYTVGGSNGSWDSATDLRTWASSQKFNVGDNLLFQYAANHNLLEVPKADYDSCQVSNALQSYSDGSTIISLSSPGKRYFICGMPGHCLQGMKVEIDTLSTASASAPTPTSITSPAAPAPVDASQAPAISKASSPSLSPATLPSDVPSTESPVPATSSIPPQPSPSASSASNGSFSRSLAFGFILTAVLMQFAF